jgi:pectin methylesterase-like acyl-CoA thioesterase
MAVPASAAGTVRYVDDNTTKACHGTHFHSIQAAINASHAKDVVYVCPGTYHEELQISVPGLTVQSLGYRKAKLVPPSDATHTALVALLADGVKFRSF